MKQDQTLILEIIETSIKNDLGSYESGDFVMSYKDPMYIVKDKTNDDRVILQMNKDHYDIKSACLCVDALAKRRKDKVFNIHT